MIYGFFNILIKGYLKFRRFRIESMYKNPYELQEEVFLKLLEQLQQTSYGKLYKSEEIKNYKQFARRIPLVKYEGLFPYIQRMMQGESNVLWPGTVKWYAKSSGTTNDRS